jgi:hypothetical protein
MFNFSIVCKQSNKEQETQTNEDELVQRSCANCNITESTSVRLQRCSRCKRIYYHSRECQQNHWKRHSLPCRAALIRDEAKQRDADQFQELLAKLEVETPGAKSKQRAGYKEI